MTDAARGLMIYGTMAHTPSRGALEIIEDALVTVDGHGVIDTVINRTNPRHDEILREARRSGDLIELTETQLLMPGFVDLHVHAPQWPQLGKALDLPLEEWLQERTFPLEARYVDLGFAEESYNSLVETLLANGSTTAVYFGTIHVPATQLLAEICMEKGQRAFVGKVAMDNPDQCPDYYRDASAEAGLDGTRALIEHIRGLAGAGPALVQPIVTPRFIPSCTDALLAGLGDLAAELDCAIQTHCSESDWEHAHVFARCGANDASSLDRFRLLTDRSVLAHGVFLSDEDMGLILDRGAGIAHCPLSNYYFSNAVFPARRALDRGLKVGLGTDIAGGPSPSLLTNAAMAVTSSRALEEGADATAPAGKRGVKGARIDFKEALWMATAGGGRVLGLKIGLIAPGYAFDAIVVDTETRGSNIRAWEELDTPEDRVQRIIMSGGRENVVAAWVQGKRVEDVGVE
jgi:guanine deaminase